MKGYGSASLSKLC